MNRNWIQIGMAAAAALCFAGQSATRSAEEPKELAMSCTKDTAPSSDQGDMHQHGNGKSAPQGNGGGKCGSPSGKCGSSKEKSNSSNGRYGQPKQADSVKKRSAAKKVVQGE